MPRPSYTHLTLEERRKLAQWRYAGIGVAEIADLLGRNRTTIYRELKRNAYRDKELPELNGYYAMNAQSAYEKRRAIHRKLVRYPDVLDAVLDRLKGIRPV